MSIIGGPDIPLDSIVCFFDGANLKSYPRGGNTLFNLLGPASNAPINGTTTFSDINQGAFFFDQTAGDNTIGNFTNVRSGPNNFTIIMSILPLAGNNGNLLTPNSNGADNFLTYDAFNQRIRVTFVESADTNSRTRTATAGSSLINQWSIVGLSINNLNVKLWINGKLGNEYNEMVPIGPWESAWRLGGRFATTALFNGYIGFCLIYNRELMASEMRRIFNSFKGRYGL